MEVAGKIVFLCAMHRNLGLKLSFFVCGPLALLVVMDQDAGVGTGSRWWREQLYEVKL